MTVGYFVIQIMAFQVNLLGVGTFFVIEYTFFYIRNLDRAIVLKVSSFHMKFVHFSTTSFLISFLFFECRIINVVTNIAADMFRDI